MDNWEADKLGVDKPDQVLEEVDNLSQEVDKPDQVLEVDNLSQEVGKLVPHMAAVVAHSLWGK